MKYSKNNTPIKCIMKNSTCYKGTTTFVPKGVLWHSTGANNTKISRYVQPYETDSNYDEMIAILGKNKYCNDWNHITRKAGVNAWIGKLADGTVTSVQTLEWNQKPWGCGSGSKGSCNSTHIQFEICEDSLNDKSYFDKVYKEACELTAYLCKIFNIDPYGKTTINGVSVPTILCHKDSYELGLGSNHGDVIYWFSKYGKSMDDVRKDVAKLVGKIEIDTKPVTYNTFNVGDEVKIVDKKYYNGKTVPNWVCNKTWIVHSVSGDKVIVNKSADGKESIMSPFNVNSLKLVNSTSSKPVKPVESVSTTQTIKKGDVVSILKNAKYYNGKTVPNWVCNKTWIVESVSGKDRIVIDKSSDGKESICSAINSKYLKVVKNSSTSGSSTISIKKGCKVKVKAGAKTYTGGSLASFVYKNVYTVIEEPKGNRVVIGTSSDVIAAINSKDLIVVSK